MSGVYIKDMEMPKSCDMCWALDDYGDYPRCRITEEQRGYTFPIRQKRMDNCPLVPVPPHGDLIDAEELRSVLRKRAKEFSNSEYGEGVKCGLADAREYIKIAPTIIPAEEGET